VVLGGGWADSAPALSALVAVHCLLLNPSRGGEAGGTGDDVSIIRSDGSLPLAASAARGVALDPATAGETTVRGAVRALGAGRRLVAPVTTALPAEVVELARDETLWVAERGAPASGPVAIGIARRTAR
jgi:hypothetical protein